MAHDAALPLPARRSLAPTAVALSTEHCHPVQIYKTICAKIIYKTIYNTGITYAHQHIYTYMIHILREHAAADCCVATDASLMVMLSSHQSSGVPLPPGLAFIYSATYSSSTQ